MIKFLPRHIVASAVLLSLSTPMANAQSSSAVVLPNPVVFEQCRSTLRSGFAEQTQSAKGADAEIAKKVMPMMDMIVPTACACIAQSIEHWPATPAEQAADPELPNRCMQLAIRKAGEAINGR
jgi:hypothetical protein